MATVTRFHVGLSVRGALCWSRRELDRMAKSMNRAAGETFRCGEDLRDALMEELSRGHEIIPIVPCDKWDWKTGCKGHPQVGGKA